MREREGFCFQWGELIEASGESGIVVVHKVRSGWICRQRGVRDGAGHGR